MPEAEYLQFGGQAVVEGVMMRSPKFFAIACRAPNGQIVVRTEPLEKSWFGRFPWFKYPFVRGAFALIDSMILGNKAMRFSSLVQIEDQYQLPDPNSTSSVENKESSKTINSITVGVTMVIGILIGIGLFVYVPNLIAQLIQGKKDAATGSNKGLTTNLISEGFKILILLGYLWLISRMDAIREIFRYHGAEHKAINVMEAHEELNVANARRITRLHPRCGTSFAIIVLIVGLIIFPFIPRYLISGNEHARSPFLDSGARLLIELIVLPIIAGISYELLRLAGKFRDQKWVNLAFWPGLASQKYLTTVEPEDKHLEVAIASLNAVIEAEKTGNLTVEDDYKLTIAAEKP